MAESNSQSRRARICRLSDIPADLRAHLASGKIQTASWTEWMATDMSALARAVAHATPHPVLVPVLFDAAERAEGRGILARLAIFGRALSKCVAEFCDPAFVAVARHKADVVRQWAAYAVNDAERRMPLCQRLGLTLPFAADDHMSVRECAWMAFRPHLAASLRDGLTLLEPISRASDAKLRRFAIEVTRPRSVWGAHIPALKQTPEIAVALLDNVYQDESRYVRLSAGNWLNDASKTQPEWVRAVCSRWSESGNKYTEAIIRRSVRTLERRGRLGGLRCSAASLNRESPVHSIRRRAVC